eukprot:CAMPEP_0171094678 /NCGR_PEP_ID=MMETSP0766_2-20121228/41998_1 /TAXON_ID=439317 /ORGANISM="Gambierdiscus australes, Strain CAWD 149" /LENGTH=380 /DNA_ID=CAMNT_0011553369 /DNA_START=63 /DNA_END=1205 /DNA_ORIENTATION=-
MPCLLMCALVAAASAARGGHKVASSQGTAIKPALAPESDKKFFGYDYPDDARPEPSRMHLKKFDHPYPAVQDHETYDKDYVKDENADDGEWKAQMDYDRLRNKIRQQKEAVDQARRRADEEGELVDAAAEKEKSAHERAEEAEREAEKARKAAKEAHDELEKLVGENAAASGDADGKKANGTSGSQGGRAGNGTGGTAGEVGGEIGAAAGNVTNKIKVLEECQRQLAEAKARLKAAMALKEQKAKEKAAVQAAKEARDAKARSEYDEAISNTTAKHNGTQVKAQTAEEALDSEERRLEKAVAEAEAAHRAALRAYKEEEELMDKEEGRLKEAAERLRHYRAQVDQDGGVTRAEKPPSKSACNRAAAIASLLGLNAVLMLA